LPPDAVGEVRDWIGRIKEYGIRSIISLMHPKELRHYDQLDLGADDLIDFYRRSGFDVRHIPWDDPTHRPSSQGASFAEELVRVREEALAAFDVLPKPVLLHCSAGIDRSSPVAAFIFEMRSAN
jgi:protein-tyrosine phosphatase